MNTPENQSQFFEDDPIDLISILKKIYQGRKLITLSTAVAAILGTLVSLTTPNIYTANTTFIPQINGNSKPSPSLSGIASLAGINLGNVQGNSEIPPTLYPQIISSVPYKLDLLETPIKISSNFLNLADYLNNNSDATFFDLIKEFTFGLPGKILSLIKGLPSEEDNQTLADIYQISERDRNLFGILDSKLNLSLNEKEGAITIEFTDENKFIAAQVAKRAKELLQERIINFKNQSALEVLNFTTKQLHENKVSYESLQDSIAIFKDQNLNISSLLYQNRLDRLEKQLNIASIVVEQLASQVEQAKLQVNKDTPVFTIIEPVTIPFQRSAPKRSLIVIIWIFFGFVFSTGFILVKDTLKNIIDLIRT